MPVFPAVPDAPGTPGALITQDGQYEFRGLLFGAGTDYVVEKMDGLLSAPPVQDSDFDRGHQHGALPGTTLYRKKLIACDMKIHGRPGVDIEDKISEATRAFQLPRIRNSRVMEPLVFKRLNAPKKILFVRCDKRDLPSDYKTARGLVYASVGWTAPDPLTYALTPLTESLVLNPGEVAGTFIATGLGSHVDGAPPVITISGPATNPIIENETDDERAIRLQVVLTAADQLRIDVGARTVETKAGAADWVRNYAIVRSDSQWWNVLPGPNTINYNRTGSATASTITVDWRDVWS